MVLDDVKTGPALGLAGKDFEYRQLKAHARHHTQLPKYRPRVAGASGVSSLLRKPAHCEHCNQPCTSSSVNGNCCPFETALPGFVKRMCGRPSLRLGDNTVCLPRLTGSILSFDAQRTTSHID